MSTVQAYAKRASLPHGLPDVDPLPGGLALRFARVKRYRDDKVAGRVGHVTAVDLVEKALERIDALDEQVRAWVCLDREAARRTAAERDADARAGRFRGALHGIPVGVKDIFDVAGMVTTAGAAPFAHRLATEDAAAVALLRQAGAIVLGKTVTTEFAFLDPADTRNPWNLRHTPGGSSSGSAAAVAAGMVPLAIGSQTIGSTIRPAGYCGVVGLKPAYGTIDRAGMAPLAPSLDHVGIFARSVADAAVALEVLAGRPSALPVVDGGSRTPRLGVARRLLATAAPEVADHLEAIAETLRGAGALVDDVELPPADDGFFEAGLVVLRVEAATVHAERFAAHRNEYRPKIRELIEAGMEVSTVEYDRGREHLRQFRVKLSGLLDEVDALLAPVADTPAPEGLASTGNPSLCAPATFTGFPAIALPSGLARNGLPLAVQLVAATERTLLAAASWCEAQLGFDHAPRPRALEH
jgi:Asp-tRNA(Asn)/Glu-tRNA(Gln) amidotransferase A subunit family amidase